MNLQSKQITLATGQTAHIHGDSHRKFLSMYSAATTKLDGALAPLGTTDPTAFWLIGSSVGQGAAPLTVSHSGEAFLRGTGSPSAVINLVSDYPMTITIT